MAERLDKRENWTSNALAVVLSPPGSGSTPARGTPPVPPLGPPPPWSAKPLS